jgi:hypothetical protein
MHAGNGSDQCGETVGTVDVRVVETIAISVVPESRALGVARATRIVKADTQSRISIRVTGVAIREPVEDLSGRAGEGIELAKDTAQRSVRRKVQTDVRSARGDAVRVVLELAGRTELIRCK